MKNETPDDATPSRGAQIRRKMMRYESALKYAEERRADKIEEELICGNPKDFTEDLWDEIEQILHTIHDQTRMDQMEDLTLMDLARRAAENRAARDVQSGLLDDDADEIMRESEDD